MVKVEVLPFNVPSLVMSPATEWLKLPALKMEVFAIQKLPFIVQAEGAVIPALLVLEIITSCKAAGVPVIVIRPAPPNTTVPVLEKEVPARRIVAADGGVKFKVPVLVTVPLLVKLFAKVCVETPPLKIAPLLTVNPASTTQFTLGLMPAVLL